MGVTDSRPRRSFQQVCSTRVYVKNGHGFIYSIELSKSGKNYSPEMTPLDQSYDPPPPFSAWPSSKMEVMIQPDDMFFHLRIYSKPSSRTSKPPRKSRQNQLYDATDREIVAEAFIPFDAFPDLQEDGMPYPVFIDKKVQKEPAFAVIDESTVNKARDWIQRRNEITNRSNIEELGETSGFIFELRKIREFTKPPHPRITQRIQQNPHHITSQIHERTARSVVETQERRLKGAPYHGESTREGSLRQNGHMEDFRDVASMTSSMQPQSGNSLLSTGKSSHHQEEERESRVERYYSIPSAGGGRASPAPSRTPQLKMSASGRITPIYNPPSPSVNAAKNAQPQEYAHSSMQAYSSAEDGYQPNGRVPSDTRLRQQEEQQLEQKQQRQEKERRQVVHQLQVEQRQQDPSEANYSISVPHRIESDTRRVYEHEYPDQRQQQQQEQEQTNERGYGRSASRVDERITGTVHRQSSHPYSRGGHMTGSPYEPHASLSYAQEKQMDPLNRPTADTVDAFYTMGGDNYHQYMQEAQQYMQEVHPQQKYGMYHQGAIPDGHVLVSQETLQRLEADSVALGQNSNLSKLESQCSFYKAEIENLKELIKRQQGQLHAKEQAILENTQCFNDRIVDKEQENAMLEDLSRDLRQEKEELEAKIRENMSAAQADTKGEDLKQMEAQIAELKTQLEIAIEDKEAERMINDKLLAVQQDITERTLILKQIFLSARPDVNEHLQDMVHNLKEEAKRKDEEIEKLKRSQGDRGGDSTLSDGSGT